MAKGRRLTTSRSERYLGAYTGHAHGNGSQPDGSEFCEGDVWSSVDAGGEDEGNGGGHGYYGNGHEESEWRSSAADMARISRRDRNLGGLSLAFEESGRTTSSRIVHPFRAQDGVVLGTPQTRRQHHMATSAPMNVPDWSMILQVDSAESMHDDSEEGCFEGECDSAVDPPHEYLARSRKTAATSVFEGVGRTLKGRDMSRLRDAVWSQTGFDG